MFKKILIIIAIFLLSSCGSNSETPKENTSNEGKNSKNTTNNSSDATIIQPTSKSQIHEKTVSINGKERKFNIYAPTNLTNGASIVFIYHGSSPAGPSSNPTYRYSQDEFAFNQIATENNIIMVYPVGAESYGELRWDAREGSSDFDFFDAMVNYLENSLKKDNGIQANMKKLYISGHSSGAIFSFALAGYRANKITAVVPLSGQFALDKGDKTVNFIKDNISVPLRAYNGTQDTIVNYDSSYSNMKKWHEKENKGNAENFTTRNIQIETIRIIKGSQINGQYDIIITKWQGGISDLEMYSIIDGRHSQDWLNLGDSIWGFMSKHERE